MAKNNFFQFKQFKVVQEKAAMKVGIDGVLLGAWADLGSEARILDVGTVITSYSIHYTKLYDVGYESHNGIGLP